MLHPVKGPIGLQIYRDGGSVSASFTDAHDELFVLFFRVSLTDEFVRIGYHQPVLEWYVPKEPYVSPISGHSHESPPQMQSQSITWEEARNILSQLEPYMVEYTSDSSWIFFEMKASAERDGARVDA